MDVKTATCPNCGNSFLENDPNAGFVYIALKTCFGICGKCNSNPDSLDIEAIGKSLSKRGCSDIIVEKAKKATQALKEEKNGSAKQGGNGKSKK